MYYVKRYKNSRKYYIVGSVPTPEDAFGLGEGYLCKKQGERYVNVAQTKREFMGVFGDYTYYAWFWAWKDGRETPLGVIGIPAKNPLHPSGTFIPQLERPLVMYRGAWDGARVAEHQPMKSWPMSSYQSPGVFYTVINHKEG